MLKVAELVRGRAGGCLQGLCSSWDSATWGPARIGWTRGHHTLPPLGLGAVWPINYPHGQGTESLQTSVCPSLLCSEVLLARPGVCTNTVVSFQYWPLHVLCEQSTHSMCVEAGCHHQEQPPHPFIYSIDKVLMVPCMVLAVRN